MLLPTPLKMHTEANKITTHFSLHEFSCRCGCEMPSYVRREIELLALRLEVIRAYFDRPLIINSGYRCHAYNRLINGARTSYHIKGMAADFVVVGLNSASVQKAVEALMDVGDITKGGIGYYSSFTHYDRRGYVAKF